MRFALQAISFRKIDFSHEVAHDAIIGESTRDPCFEFVTLPSGLTVVWFPFVAKTTYVEELSIFTIGIMALNDYVFNLCLLLANANTFKCKCFCCGNIFCFGLSFEVRLSLKVGTTPVFWKFCHLKTQMMV